MKSFKLCTTQIGNRSKMDSNLKLYVWEDYGCDYTCGIAFALAESVEEARKSILQRYEYCDEETLEREPKVFDAKISFHVFGGG